jgi:ribonuclease P protein component
VLLKNYRLKKRNDFDKAFRKGWKFKEDFLSLRVAKNIFKKSRFGFIVSQKVSKKAVLRNKIKRRLRAIVNMKLPKIKNGLDIVLIANPGLEKKDFWELEEIVENIFKKANLFQK